MANLLLTEKCVRACPYCFAKEYLNESKENILPWENLIYVADLFEVSNERQLALLGGEPTLHPNFVDFVLYLHERRFKVNVFTSGIMANKTLETAIKYLLKIPAENLMFTCNYNHPKTSTANETKQINKFLKSFSKYITLSFNLYQPEFELKYLVDAIVKYDLRKHIRLGLAQPIPGQKNECLAANEVRYISKTLRNQLDLLEKHRITLSFDCGMPMCIFSDEDLGRLFKLNRGKILFTCYPAIDIGPDLQVWACFPLSNYEKKSLYDFNSVDEIKHYFIDKQQNIRNCRDVARRVSRNKGIFDECNKCVHFAEKLCNGGCLAHLIKN